MAAGVVLVATSIGSGMLAVRAFSGPAPVDVALETPDLPPPPAPLDPGRSAHSVRIRPGSTFGALATSLGVSGDAVLAASRSIYDLTKIRPDRELVIWWEQGEAAPIEIHYVVDEDRTLVVARDDEAWRASLDEVTYEARTAAKTFEIRRSLWQDGLAAGLRPAGLMKLAAIFEYELDFNTELRAGASFTVVGDLLSADGKPDRFGAIHAVKLDNGAKTWSVYRHVNAEGGEAWYREDGTSLRKPFLRSPLEFSRVTSGFNPKRFHPVLKQTRPHNGTDFGAPTGTPVRAVADGRVVQAGSNGGHGNFVKIDHDGGYATSYSHLSRIHVKNGQRVRQGHVVGAVGATGLATGPHLHYQMWKNGRFVDPMTIALPSQAPLPSSQRGAFAASVARWKPMLE